MLQSHNRTASEAVAQITKRKTHAQMAPNYSAWKIELLRLESQERCTREGFSSFDVDRVLEDSVFGRNKPGIYRQCNSPFKK